MELQLECKDAVTGEDIVDKLLLVVCILKECDDLHALTKLKEKDTRKICCRTAAPKNAKNEENKMLKQPPHRPLLKRQRRAQRS